MTAVKKFDAMSDHIQGTPSLRREGGPVFLPRRRPSALARKLLSQPWDTERITPWDKQWFVEAARAPGFPR